MRLTLVNPNTSRSTTATMVGLARRAAPRATIVGLTAATGAPLITEPDALCRAARAVVDLAPAISADAPDGVIVAAFGDPGRARLSRLLPCPVTGIAEAAMADAASRAARFAVVTTTPLLLPTIAAAATAYGHGDRFLGTVVTDGEPAEVMADPDGLETALEEACRRAITTLGAGALIIGGGPLAVAARALRARFDVPIVEPIPAAVALAVRRADPG
jgi:allantoin racemase